MQDLRRRVFAYRAVRVGVRLPNPIAPYDFAFNKTSRHRGTTQNMHTALQRGIPQSEDRTVAWYYILRKHANMRRLSSFRVGELIFQRVQAFPTFFCCCIFLVQHVPAWWRRNAAPFQFAWYTLYVVQYIVSQFFAIGIPKVPFRQIEILVLFLLG